MVNNIVQVTFRNGLRVTTASRKLYQWDYGIILKINGLDLPAAYEVHFSNTQRSGDADIVIGDENGALIPNYLLETGLNVYAWIYLHTGTDDGETVYEITVPVIKRAKPRDYTPTPHEQTAIEQAIEALNKGVTDAEAYAEEAKGYAEEAKQTLDGKQDKLIPGDGISISDDNVISATGGTGGGELEADLVVSNPIGKYTMNETIDKGTAFETIFRGMLSKTYYPALTDSSLSVSYSAPALMKVGAMVPSQAATLNFNRGSINPQYTAESQYRAGEATGYSASLSGASVQYSESGSGRQFTIPAFTRNSVGNVTLNGTVNYAQGAQPKDSDGGNYQTPLPAGSKSASKTIEFILPFYWGKKSTPSITDLSGLTEDLSKKGQKTYTYSNANNEYLYIVYNASYGNLRSILDENNFENLDSWVKSSLSFEGQNYNVYRSGFAITGSPPFTFKF